MAAAGDGGPGGRPLRIYSYAGCSTCRRALRWLHDQQLAVEVVDIVSTPPSPEELRQALAALGDRKPLFNASGQSYRALGAATVKAMGDEQALAALAADGKLIKRPFVLLPSGGALTGFDLERWSRELLASPST